MENSSNDFFLRNWNEINLFWQRRKWWVLLSVTLPALVVLFLLLFSRLEKRELMTMKYLSLNLATGELQVDEMQREDFEKISFFLEDEKLWQTYLRELSLPPENKLWKIKPASLFSATFSFQLTSEKIKKELLQYVTLKTTSLSIENLAMVNDFFKNVFSNYFVIDFLNKYQLFFLQKTYISLSSRKDLLEKKELNEKKIENLYAQKKIPFSNKERYQLMLQLEPQNERYLEIEHQIAANEILLNDYKNALEANADELALITRIIEIIKNIEAKYFSSFCWTLDKPFQELNKYKEVDPTKRLNQEIIKLETVFELVAGSFNSNSFFSSKKTPEYYIKIMFLYLFLVCLGVMLTLLLDKRRKKRSAM
jgi:hypothetical protein